MSEERVIRDRHELDRSVWLDNLGRRLLLSGEVQRLRDRGVTGISSNPTVIHRAVSESSVYDDAVGRLAAAGRNPARIVWELMIEDVKAAADIFRPVYERTGGRDGFASIEVSPYVAHSAGVTVAMVRELRARCARPNVMIKIPATREGLTAIRESIAAGANVNVTLIFAVSRYRAVVEAFLSGLEELVRNGGNPGEVHSVASFFVSRLDTKVDARIDQRLGVAPPAERHRLSELRGKIGLANSKLGYQWFKWLHAGNRWRALARAGATPQRCLWASTSVKDFRYPDTLFADSLRGPETTHTLPEKTLEAFVDHGQVRRSLDTELDQAHRQLGELEWLGIYLPRVTEELVEEGIGASRRSYDDLLQVVSEMAIPNRAKQ